MDGFGFGFDLGELVAVVSSGATGGSRLLLEAGDAILAENGDTLILET